MSVSSIYGSNAATAVHRAATTASGTSTGAESSGTVSSTTITSADFLTLLVTQLQNQDPTTPTDPTQYVQQLVGVNSLEQLIDINAQLTSLGGKAATTSSSGSATGV